MFWEFPIKIPTLNTKTEELSYTEFHHREKFLIYLRSQFKLPGKYNLKTSDRWQDAGMQYTKTVTLPNFEGGYYTDAIKGTYKWKKFWASEKEKVLNGYIVDDIYVPPFYYWYLNYCPIYDDI